MADKPVTEVVAVDAALDALSSPTSSDVYEAVDAFNEKAVSAAAAARALAGGGSQPGAVRMLGPFSIAAADFVGPDGFNFVAAPIYTPTVGDALIGYSWLLRTPFDSTLTEANIAPQTSADTGTAGPALLPVGAVITMQNVQGQGAGNTGGDYYASYFLALDQYDAAGTVPSAPSTFGPVISDGTGLYLSGGLGEGIVAPTMGQLDIYVYVATPALA